MDSFLIYVFFFKRTFDKHLFNKYETEFSFEILYLNYNVALIGSKPAPATKVSFLKISETNYLFFLVLLVIEINFNNVYICLCIAIHLTLDYSKYGSTIP